MVFYADTAGMTIQLLCNVRRPLKGRVTSVLVRCPIAASHSPDLSGALSFPAAVRVADTYVRARGEGRLNRPRWTVQLSLSLPSCFREMTRLLSLAIRGVRGDLSVPVPFSFEGCA